MTLTMMTNSTTRRTVMACSFGVVLTILSMGSTLDAVSAGGAINYGVDVSFPIHHRNVSVNYDYLPHQVLPSLYPTPLLYRDMPPQPLGNRQAGYDEYMKGCTDRYEPAKCWEYEEDRITVGLRQPQSMVNYTENGFLKISAPDNVWMQVSEFWKRNQERWMKEVWPEGNTYTNHWSAPTYIVPINDSSLRGGMDKFKRNIFDAARTSLQEWTGEDITDHSIYGIRVYTDGAVLSSHVDRLPQVLSVILNVAQDVDEPWPIELIGHDGRAHNVTLEPGEFLMYESHSIIHGRPFPLKGRYCANLFIHMEPTGHSVRYHDHAGTDSNSPDGHNNNRHFGGHETNFVPGALPPYILPDSPEAVHWQLEHNPPSDNSLNHGYPLHDLAAEGRTRELMDYLYGKEYLVHSKDAFGWTPLHEGARSGFIDIVRYLVQIGANIHERTHHGTGGTALFYAQKTHGPNHPVCRYLESLGAQIIPPNPDL